MNDHVILVGWDGFSERLFLELHRSSVPVGIACTNSADSIKDKYGDMSGVRVLEMTSYDAIGQLEKLEANSAARFFVNLDSDEDKLLRVVDIAERKDWKGEIDVVLENERLEDTFRDAGVRYAVSRQQVSSKLLATYIYEPDVAETTERLFTSTHTEDGLETPKQGQTSTQAQPEGRFGIQQHKVGPNLELPESEPIDEGTYAYDEFVFTLREKFGAIPLAIYRDGSLNRLPDPETPVSPGDYLLIALRREDEEAIRSLLDATAEGRLSDNSP